MLRLGISPERGRGVFAAHAVRAGEILEEAPVLVVPASEVASLKRTRLFDYYFLWGEASGDVAICFGFGSLYNHSNTPNATYQRCFQSETIRFRALRDLREGEEIFTNYHAGRNNDTPFGFEADCKEKS